MNVLIRVLIAIILSKSCMVSAYEVATHEELTERIYNSSQLGLDETLFDALGIQDDEEFESAELSDTKIETRTPPKIPLYIMRSGATFEDEGGRALNHFFDPYHEAEDTVNHVGGFISPLWSIEHTGGGQIYSYRKAREYLFNSLTAINETNRDESFSNLFRSFGHIVHHIQDMAQAEHVRKDSHLKLDWLPDFFGLEDHSLYEAYTKSVTRGESIDGHLQTQFFAQMDGYAPVNFTNPRDYWHTDGEGAYNGLGLAEFTNRNFVSKDTNFGMDDAKDYPRPCRNDEEDQGACVSPAFPFTVEDVSSIFTAYEMTVPAACQNPESPCAMKFYSTAVSDNLRPGSSGTNAFATTESIFNQDIEKYNLRGGRVKRIVKKFTLNKINFWSRYPFLLSRAVGYSAGLINYFFRGRLEAEDIKFDGKSVSLRVKNAIDANQHPEWSDETMLAGGELVVSFKYEDEAGEMAYGRSTSVILGEDLAPQQLSEQRYTFAYPLLPDLAKMLEYRIVYRGNLGSEGEDLGVAFGTFEPESALLVLLGVRQAKDSSGIATVDQYVVRSIDGGRTWSKSLGPINTFSSEGAVSITGSSIGNIVSSGLGTASVFFANQYDRVNSIYDGPGGADDMLLYDHIRYCTDDAGLNWEYCGFTTQRTEARSTETPLYDGMPYPQFGLPFVSGIYNAGERLIAFKNILESGSNGNWYAKIYTGVGKGSLFDGLSNSWRFSHSTLPDTCRNGAPQGDRCRGRIIGLKHSHQELSVIADDGSNRVDRTDPITTRVYSSTDNGLSWQSEPSEITSDNYRRRPSSFFPLKYENVYDAGLIVTAQDTLPRSFYPASKRVTFSPLDEAGAFSIDISQFTSHDAAVFLGLANLGDGRLVMPYTKFFGLDPRLNGHIGETAYLYIPFDDSQEQYTQTGFLRSDDYGRTWEEVSSFKTKADESSTGIERLFIRAAGDNGYDSRLPITPLNALNFFSGFVDIEAVPLKSDQLNIVK